MWICYGSSRGGGVGDASNLGWTIGYSQVGDASGDCGVGLFGGNKLIGWSWRELHLCSYSSSRGSKALLYIGGDKVSTQNLVVDQLAQRMATCSSFSGQAVLNPNIVLMYFLPSQKKKKIDIKKKTKNLEAFLEMWNQIIYNKRWFQFLFCQKGWRVIYLKLLGYIIWVPVF